MTIRVPKSTSNPTGSAAHKIRTGTTEPNRTRRIWPLSTKWLGDLIPVGTRAAKRPPDTMCASGALAEWLGTGLQNLVHRFDSGRRLSSAATRPLGAAGTD